DRPPARLLRPRLCTRADLQRRRRADARAGGESNTSLIDHRSRRSYRTYMSTLMRRAFIALIVAAAPAMSAEPASSAERSRAELKLLAGDRFEGRGVGTRGEELATDFIAREFAT